MVFKSTMPILYSSDIRRSIQYYTQVLGFTGDWEWDSPPTFGGVSKDLVHLFFCKEAQGHPGSWIYITVDNVDELHSNISAKGGQILTVPEDKEWGLREMLVKDPDDNIIRFGQHKPGDRTKSSSLPANISIVERLPTVEEFESLIKAVGWKLKSREKTIAVLNAPLWAAIAEDVDSHQTIGCVLLVGDGASFYYVKDMMVDPAYQNKNVGTALMHHLNQWLEANAEREALVGLYTGENLAPFYRQFGFQEAFGMCRRI